MSAAVRRQLARQQGSLMLQVRGTELTSAVATALEAAFEDWSQALRGSDTDDIGPPSDLQVIAHPDGPLVYVDAHDLGTGLADKLADAIAVQLSAVAVGGWQIEVPPATPHLAGLIDDERSGPAVSLWMIKAERSDDRQFQGLAEQWLAGRTSTSDRAQVTLGPFSFDITLTDLWDLIATRAPIIEACLGLGQRGARYISRSGDILRLAGGGWGITDDELLELAEELEHLARANATQTTYAFVDFSMGLTLPLLHEDDLDMAPMEAVEWLPDELVYDAAPFQILGSTHVDRLPDKTRRLLRPAGTDRFELQLGELTDWLPAAADRRKKSIKSGRKVLRGLLVTTGAARDRLVQRSDDPPPS